jgi:hypothetical protein
MSVRTADLLALIHTADFCNTKQICEMIYNGLKNAVLMLPDDWLIFVVHPVTIWKVP